MKSLKYNVWHSAKISLGMPKSRKKIDIRNRPVSDPDVRTLNNYD